MSEREQLIEALGNENWSVAEPLASEFVARFAESDATYEAAFLRYMHLLSCAGRVSEGTLSYDSLRARVLGYVGKPMVLATHPVAAADRKQGFNVMGVKDGADSIGFTTATNNKATSILAFEYVSLPEPLDLRRHQGEKAQFAGILERIEFNPNGSTIWIMRLHLSDGQVDFYE